MWQFDNEVDAADRRKHVNANYLGPAENSGIARAHGLTIKRFCPSDLHLVNGRSYIFRVRGSAVNREAASGAGICYFRNTI